MRRLNLAEQSALAVEACEASDADWPEQVLIEARAALVEAGVRAALAVSPICPRGAVLLAEAVNLAGKQISDEFYDIKAATWVAAAQIPGVIGGWCSDGTFSLRSDCAGTIHAHDPFGEFPGWQWVDWSWSGVPRQDLAFRLLASRSLTRHIAALTGGGTP